MKRERDTHTHRGREVEREKKGDEEDWRKEVKGGKVEGDRIEKRGESEKKKTKYDKQIGRRKIKLTGKSQKNVMEKVRETERQAKEGG